MGKSGINGSKACKFCVCTPEIHLLDQRKQQLFRSAEQLTDNVHLSTSAWSICVFWIGGIP